MSDITLRVHDTPAAADLAVVDEGLGRFNDAAAPLHEVRPLASFAHDRDGRVIGGAVGRRWGALCELQQLWVDEAHRGRGLGAALLAAFEARAREHGCTRFFLETFSFQAPEWYARRGYVEVYCHAAYPHGIARHLMVRRGD